MRGGQGRAEVSLAREAAAPVSDLVVGRAVWGVCCALCSCLAGDSPFEQPWAGCAAGAAPAAGTETLPERFESSSFPARAETTPRDKEGRALL